MKDEDGEVVLALLPVYPDRLDERSGRWQLVIGDPGQGAFDGAPQQVVRDVAQDQDVAGPDFLVGSPGRQQAYAVVDRLAGTLVSAAFQAIVAELDRDGQVTIEVTRLKVE